MKVTLRRLKIRAVYETIRVLPLVVITTYRRFLVAMMDEYIKNPRVKW